MTMVAPKFTQINLAKTLLWFVTVKESDGFGENISFIVTIIFILPPKLEHCSQSALLKKLCPVKTTTKADDQDEVVGYHGHQF